MGKRKMPFQQLVFKISRPLYFGYRACVRFLKPVSFGKQSVAWYACEASLGKERYVGLNEWKIRRSVCSRGGHTSISVTGMLVREQISTTQKNRMTLNLNPKKIECPKIQTPKNRMTQDVMVVKV